MSRIGYTWNDEFREEYFKSEKVQQNLERFVEMVRCPKPEAQRAKMSQAKKGRKYSDEHRAHMSETQRFRQALKKEIQTLHPDLPAEAVWKRVKEEMK